MKQKDIHHKWKRCYVLKPHNYKKLGLGIEKCFINYFQAKEKSPKVTYTKNDKIMGKKLRYKKEMFLINQTF